MGEGTADGRERDGEHEAFGRREAKPGMIEDANSQRVQGPVRAAGIGAGDDDQIESTLVSEFGAQNPGMGSLEAEMEECSNHLFTDAMKLQLRAQILVLGDLLKGVAPNPDWLEDACLESAIGAESVLLEPVDVPRGAQDVLYENTSVGDIPTESNLPRISSAFRDAEARMSPFSGAADLPTTRDAINDDLHSAGRLSNPGEPSSSGKEVSFRDDSLAHETEIAPSGQLLITYDHTRTARSDSNVAEDILVTENRIPDNDKHLDLAQASAQDALTTATSALAQSHMVWARLHSQDHSEEGIARDARLASVAATVAAASSVAKAAVEAARAIAEVSMDAFIQASGYQLGDARTPQFGSARSRPLQVDGWEPSPYSNARENVTPSHQRTEMLESVVQAAGKAAEAATQAGAVLAKANPMIQTAGLSGFWSRKPDEADVEHEGDEANEMDAADEVDGFDGEFEVGALNEMDAINELDGANEEGAVEEMEDMQKEDATYQDKLTAVNEQVIANQDEAAVDDLAAANGDEVAAAIGDGVVGANEDGVVGANEAGVAAANEDGVDGANEVAEPFEQEKRISPRSRKFKRGRGRSRGVSSRAKRAKISGRVSPPPLPAQSPENPTHEEVDVSESLKDVRDENARGKKRGPKHMENAPVSISGDDTPATAPVQGPDDATHETVEVLESQKNVRDRNSRAQKRGAEHIENRPVSTTGEDIPATTPVHSPEDATCKQNDVSTSRKNARGKKRGAKHIENRPVSTTAEDIPATLPVQSLENEVHKQDDVSTSQKNTPGKKRGAKHIENRPVSTTGEDVPATTPAESPGNKVQEQDDVLESQKIARGKRRGAKQIENIPVRGDGPAAAPAESPENEAREQDDVLESQKIVRGKRRGAKQIENTPVRGDEPATALAESPEKEVREQDDVLESQKTVRGKRRGAKQIENTPVKGDGPASAPAECPENEVQEQDDVLESQKTVRGKRRGAKQIENTPVKGDGPAAAPAESPEKEVREQDDVLESQKTVRGKRRGAKQIENTPVKGDGPAAAPAESPEKEVREQDDVLESQKTVRGKRRGAKQIENTPVKGDGSATAPAESPEKEVQEQDDVLESQKTVRGKRRGAKQIDNTPVKGDGPATAPAESPENEVQEQDDVLESQKTVRGKRRGAKQIENTPVKGDGPAAAPAESPENEVLKRDDVSTSRKNALGNKRGVKNIENISVNTTGVDIPATGPAQKPENELHKKDEVSKIRKNVQDENVRGSARSAKHIENTTVSTPEKDIADRDLRHPQTGTNTLEVLDNGLQEGSAVEVMIDEVGLRGGWFSGTVLRMIKNEVFVELHDLLTDDGKTNVREWFPLAEGLNPCHPRRHARPVHPFTIFSEAGSRKRRRVALGSQTWHIGDQVDGFIQDAWWEGIVAEINDLDPTKATVYFPEENDTQIVKTWDLRPSFQWKDTKWIPWKNPELMEEERPQKRHKTGGPNKVVRPDVMTSNDKSSEGRAEGSRIQEAISETHKSPVKDQQESKTSFQRSNWKKSNKKNVSPEQKGRSSNEVRQTDVLSLGTSKHLDFAMDATVPTASTQGKTPLIKGKRRRRRRRYT